MSGEDNKEIRSITFEDLKAKGFQFDGDKVVVIVDDLEGTISPEELEKVRAHAWELWVANLIKIGSRKGARDSTQGARTGRLPDRDDAGTAEVQPDAAGARGEAGAGRRGQDQRPDRRNQSFAEGKIALIQYRNHRGVTEWRRIYPRYIEFRASEWHDHRPEWILHATCLERQAEREFAMNNIITWTRSSDQTLPWRQPDVVWPVTKFVAAQGIINGELVDFYDDELHPSHTTRVSDASSFDEICTKCGATDISGGGWGRLKYPCPK